MTARQPMRPVRGCAVVALACAAAVGCSRGARSGAADSARAHTAAVRPPLRDSAAGAVDLGAGSYRVEPLSAVGSVVGTIELAGPVPPAAPMPTPAEGAMQASSDRAGCDTAGASIAAAPKGLSDAIVWIADARAGKDFPVEKWIELSSRHCELDPRVEATVAGATVNVFNDDQLLHRLVFTRLGTHDTLTVMPFFDVGQVVADDRIAREPGIVEVQCVIHPWTRGYIAVFDQPYYDVTNDAGTFKIDSLPPGSYTVTVWHAGADTPVSRQVQVAAGAPTRVNLAIGIAKAP